MSVEVKAGSVLEATVPTMMFQTHIFEWTNRENYAYQRNGYAVTSDGQRVFVNTATEARASITVVVNWAAGLKTD